MLQKIGMKTHSISRIATDNAEKTDLEILQERAEVLGRAGERLSAALQNLKNIGDSIERKMASFHEMTRNVQGSFSFNELFDKHSQAEFLLEINSDIQRYNEAREYAKLRFYYLIVTREAIGFRRHRCVEEQYPIPPKKKVLKKISWTDSKNKE